MKLAASKYYNNTSTMPPPFRRRTSSFLNQRNWASVYEGFPNAQIEAVLEEAYYFRVTLILSNGTRTQLVVGDVQYHVGRRGSLGYLDPQLFHEVIPYSTDAMTTSQSLREKTEMNSEVASNVFAMVRHAFGCCVDVAGRIMTTDKHIDTDDLGTGTSALKTVKSRSFPSSIPNGISATSSSPSKSAWSHDDLHILRRESVAANCLK